MASHAAGVFPTNVDAGSCPMPSIDYDKRTGAIQNATLLERLGLSVLKFGAWASKPMYHNGFSIGAKILRAIVPSSKSVLVQLNNDSKFEFPYGDPYWSVLLPVGHDYSDEMEPYLPRFKDIDYVFVDCGANYGYFSTLMSGESMGAKACLAIEAHPETANLCKRNAALNGNRFAVINNAVFNTSGVTMDIFGAKHEARSIVDQEDGVRSGSVETITLDDALKDHQLDDDRPAILKLDVEGAEVQALEGASNLLTRDVMIIYEEHGAERTNEVSTVLRDRYGMRLFFGNGRKGDMREVTTDAEISAIKRNTRTGYDIFACREGVWLEQLQEIASERP